MRIIAHQSLKLGDGVAVVFGTVEGFGEIILCGIGHIPIWRLLEIGPEPLGRQVKFPPLIVTESCLIEALRFGRGRRCGGRRRTGRLS